MKPTTLGQDRTPVYMKKIATTQVTIVLYYNTTGATFEASVFFWDFLANL
jgi:hypothetical protein